MNGSIQQSACACVCVYEDNYLSKYTKRQLDDDDDIVAIHLIKLKLV